MKDDSPHPRIRAAILWVIMGLLLIIAVGFVSCVIDLDRRDREFDARIEKQRQIFTGPQ